MKLQAIVVEIVVLAVCLLAPIVTQAQLAEGDDIFLGNMYYKGEVPTNFSVYWAKVTRENAGKWVSCEQSP